jgi:hypothetical protein
VQSLEQGAVHRLLLTSVYVVIEVGHAANRDYVVVLKPHNLAHTLQPTESALKHIQGSRARFLFLNPFLTPRCEGRASFMIPCPCSPFYQHECGRLVSFRVRDRTRRQINLR